MFGLLFGSHNKKLVKKWQKEHHKILQQAQKVFEAYEYNDQNAVAKLLEDLRFSAMEHLMDEDIEFNKLLDKKEKLTPELEKGISDFTKSFEAIKPKLREFLRYYTQKGVEYNGEFLIAFTEIAEALQKRIAYEEETLYRILEQH